MKMTNAAPWSLASSPTWRCYRRADYLTAPVKEVGKIRSLLTMVGGKVVYAAEPFTNMAAPKTAGKSR
jgi:hypothetical protein